MIVVHCSSSESLSLARRIQEKPSTGEPENAVDASDARMSIHLGRDADDLQQLTYLPRAVAAASEIDEPLPRDGETVSQAVDDGNGFRVVKHDVEGHAIAAALKRRGLLEETLLSSIV